MHGLDERKLKILQAIIQNYLDTGEPVGSRTISKLTDLNLSSATIRNEMSDLEDMGYIFQPHTSAGRIPTDKGYRLYVDMLLMEKNTELENMKGILIEKADRLESLLQQVARLLAVNTNYTTMVTTPQYKKKVKFIQLTEIDEDQLLAVLVFEGNIVKNKILKTSVSLTKETILKLNIVLNTFLQGLDLSAINLPIITKMKEQAGEYRELVNDILEAIMQAVTEDDDFEIYTSGTTNILRYPELSDANKASELLYTLEEKEMLSELIHHRMENDKNRGIQVYIGEETPIESMKDCAVVTATYEIDEGVYGKVGIIGPKRMDYEKVVTTLQTLMAQLDDIFKNKT
ncbi:heat-inducible transcriptional repressor HrcA [Herbinix luporum]|jgi:heat-inducible transcriptional repressor|uniref:Heat-inducible transcription repressor HrcA n=1 Tax=Herbinix luporum TaxID=1679721 RepID=A0A0K8J5E5_9FIRM|nr:heat-inducible transcriptional repressor HrcA [Herbinix luporum]MDI9489464.1 heat-inducible transcriptional repressor HrcA [Bacillota bacterium]CUH92579.1 Heat-inducible transcription repressor HrcA [Herbinix luporum]HHT56782.1 heat-inducible transcription repressor HrcA [Herbinix luporum]